MNCENWNISTIKEYEEADELMNICQACGWYYRCDKALELNDKLIELEN